MTDKPDGGRGTLLRALEAASPAITAEISPPAGADTRPVARTAALLRGWVDAVNVTDNATASVRLSSLAGSLAARDVGVEPIMQLTCRDRNRLALQSELLAASALAVPNVLIMTGDHPRHGDHPGAMPVFDLDSIGLLRAARQMRDDGTLMSGRRLRPPPHWLLGAVESPSLPADTSIARLADKIEAGAQFVQTQFVFDIGSFARWMARVRDAGLAGRCHILAGVGPVLSLRALARLRDIPGVTVPDRVAERLEAAGPTRIRAAGLQLCAETVGEVLRIPGVAGVHVMTMGGEHVIPEILQMAGLTERTVR